MQRCTQITKFIAISWLAITTSISYAATQQDDYCAIAQLQDLIQLQQYQAAYELAYNHEQQCAGQPQFDMLLGQAALNSEHPDQASFAYERVLEIEPNNFHASLQLERAYAKLGYPAGTTLGLLRSAYLGLRTGYDSNINASPRNNVFNTTGINIIIPNINTKRDAVFTDLLFGGNIKKIYDSNVALFGQLAGYVRENYGRSKYDYYIIQADAGVSRGFGKFEFALPAHYEAYHYSNHLFRSSGALSAEMTYNANPNRMLAALLEYRIFTYAHIQQRNLYLWAAATKWFEYVPAIYTEFDTRFYYANGTPKKFGGAAVTKQFYGAQIVSTFKKDPVVLPFLAADWQHAQYNGKNPVFKRRTHETFYNVTGGVVFQLTPNLAIQPDYNYTINHTNIPRFRYNRYIVEASLVYQWI